MKKTKKTAQQNPSDSPSSEPRREDIEIAAYLVWDQALRLDGSHEAHWLQAEAQLRQG